ncbi:MAG TPA: nucleoside recognition domain-containing protein, partial [Chitinophagales bacterium]|nr:nucleoside recognition domain-containing protein [Chitinophagales bacterium]
LQHSYAGIFGRTIEPIIAPLGFDWKIGIALLTSFAAREVFVGTMATLYSVEPDDENPQLLRQKMQAEINPRTNQPTYTPAVGFALLVFYAFAMQCMSTLAIVKRETNAWKWVLLMLGYMTGLAYVAAWLVFRLLS